MTMKLSSYKAYIDLKVHSMTIRSETIFAKWKPFKDDEKSFLFHPKNSFQSQDIQIIFLTFWTCRKNGWKKKIREFMMSQPG